jgi:[ribosomal protein S18]-alanine N-acetyltransferase
MSHLDPGTGLTIRVMTEGDLDRVVAIASALATAPQWSRSAYEDAVAAGNGLRIALVAEYAGRVIGFLVTRVLDSQAEIESVAVESEAQGFGFGSSLLLATLQELRLAEVAEVELEMRASNRMAWRIYERAGFREMGRRREYYRDPVEDAVLLRLKLVDCPELKFLG